MADSTDTRTLVLLREELTRAHREALVVEDQDGERLLAELLFLACFGGRHHEMPEIFAHWIGDQRVSALEDQEFLQDRYDAEND